MKSLKSFLAILIIILVCFTMIWWHATTIAQMDVQAYAKETTEETTTIVLDAGHGGYDSGAVAYDGTSEKEITLSLSLLIGEQLKQAGYEVVYTRESDEVSWESDNLTDLQTRIAIAQAANADYYVSIHTNFSAYGDGASGYETYLNFENDTIVAMAQNIHASLNALSYSVDRGLKSTQEYSLYVIDHNPIPALLLEVGFLSDEADAYALQYEQTTLANAIAKGILTSLTE